MTEHFTLEELTFTNHREFDNTPNEQELANLKRLALFLEEIKKLLGGKPILIDSAFRSVEVNRAVKSTDKSQHLRGCACDFRVPGMTPDEVVRAIKASNLQYDQLIREFDAWIHVSIPNIENAKPRKMALIIDKQGTRTYC
jgi:uncharacterized protein YcbK (DUF882 family)